MKTNQKALFIFLVWQRNKEEIKGLKHAESCHSNEVIQALLGISNLVTSYYFIHSKI
jgi:hypothetical protein